MLRALPLAFEPLRQRIDFFGYKLVSFGTTEYQSIPVDSPPLLGIIPISHRTQLSEVQNAIQFYDRAFANHKSAFFVVLPGPERGAGRKAGPAPETRVGKPGPAGGKAAICRRDWIYRGTKIYIGGVKFILSN